MKRFWKEVSIADGALLLDGRPVRTPGRLPLVIRQPALAEAVAEEWSAVGEEIDPRTMPLTSLANAAIEQIAPDPAPFAANLAAYGETDLLFYRAETPPELAARQAQKWDAPLDWARRRYDVAFVIATGIIHRPQPPETVARLSAAVGALDPFRLAALSPLVTIGGSLVLALMLTDGGIEPHAAFDTAHLDELWQAEMWGEDGEATRAREVRRADFMAAARFLSLLANNTSPAKAGGYCDSGWKLIW